MKNKITLAVLLLCIAFNSCKKEEITLYNTQITPDLSNPVIQKITNITWYRAGGLDAVVEEWSSTQEVPKASEAAASMLYSMAWLNLTLYRDGTSTMLYAPPLFNYAYIHCRGTWAVSQKEQNTVVINTETPVGPVLIKAKVINLESKENLAMLQLSMDFGNRKIMAYMNNSSNIDANAPYYDDAWYSNNPVSDSPLSVSDFIGAWATAGYDAQNSTTALQGEERKYLVMRSTHVTDLFAQTPNFFSGLMYSFAGGGKAEIIYTPNYFEGGWGTEKRVVSEATWSVKGNKVMLETDEDLYWSAGELMFSFPVIDMTNVTHHGQIGKLSLRTQAKRFYLFEVISREENGMWCRITTNNANFHGFLFKRQPVTGEKVSIKSLISNSQETK